jgi:hypothetical protein
VAKQIAALRKPTRTAWVINQFARSDPDAVTQLTDLGAELRTVERAGDGSRLRELAQTRRRLVATLVRRALEVSGQPMAPATMREEITATFAAALADEEVAEEIRRGTLVRAQRRSGFGTAQAPTLTVVPPLPDSHRAAKAKPKPKTSPTSPAHTVPTNSAATGTDLTGTDLTGTDLTTSTTSTTSTSARLTPAEKKAAQAAKEQAAQEERLAKARAKAEQTLAEAGRAVAAAAQDQREQEQAIRRLERELAAARGGLRAAGAEARRAEAAQRRARQALDRLPESQPTPGIGEDTGQ